MDSEENVTVPKYGPLKMAKFPDQVDELRRVLTDMFADWGTDEVLWLTRLLWVGISDGEFYVEDDEDDEEFPVEEAEATS